MSRRAWDRRRVPPASQAARRDCPRRPSSRRSGARHGGSSRMVMASRAPGYPCELLAPILVGSTGESVVAEDVTVIVQPVIVVIASPDDYIAITQHPKSTDAAHCAVLAATALYWYTSSRRQSIAGIGAGDRRGESGGRMDFGLFAACHRFDP